MSWKTPRFWLWLSAVALGVYLALLLTVGDTKPEASDSFLSSLKVHLEKGLDSDGIQVFTLSFGPKGRVTLAGDADTEIVKYLIAHQDARLSVEMK